MSLLTMYYNALTGMTARRTPSDSWLIYSSVLLWDLRVAVGPESHRDMLDISGIDAYYYHYHALVSIRICVLLEAHCLCA
jgi:hypothetical protein